MTTLIEASGLRKRYKSTEALRGIDFNIQAGRIVGLIGPNGAGKTTALKAILGLTEFEGQLQVLGHDPRAGREHMMRDVCFIADVAVLPRWLRVQQAIDFVGGVHPKFDLKRCEAFMARTQIPRQARVRELSKGMIVQLHLALVMAIDARLLVLDEPTLGLDLLYRKQFYQTLLEDYFDEQRTILITTHQVEEIEHILSDVMFIRDGRITLNADMESLGERFIEVMVTPEHDQDARGLNPLSTRNVFGRSVHLFDGVPRERLQPLGELRRPGLADIFVATMQGAHA